MKTLYVVIEGFEEAHAKQFAERGFYVVQQPFNHKQDALCFDEECVPFWEAYHDAGMIVGITGVPEIWPVPNLGSGFYHAGYPYFYESSNTWPTWDGNIVRDPAMWARLANRDSQRVDWFEEVNRAFPANVMLDAAYQDDYIYLRGFLERTFRHKVRVGLIWLSWPYRLRQISARYNPSALDECARVWAHFNQEFAETTIFIGIAANGFIASRKTLVPGTSLDVLLREGIEHKSSVVVPSSMTEKIRADLNGHRGVGKS